MQPVVDTRVPKPPGRSERKYRLSSSFDRVGVWSWNREFTGARRGTGSDHSELAKDMGWSPTTGASDSAVQARSGANVRGGISLPVGGAVIEPPARERRAAFGQGPAAPKTKTGRAGSPSAGFAIRSPRGIGEPHDSGRLGVHSI